MDQNKKCSSSICPFNDGIIYSVPDLFLNGLMTVESIRKCGKLCDVSLKVGNEIFTLHKIILAAVIPYFYAMFTTDMLESHQSVICLQDIQVSTLEAFINFAYTGKIIITEDNVQNLLIGADFLQMKDIFDICCTFLIQRLNNTNILNIWKLARGMGYCSLALTCKQFIELQFEVICLDDSFLALTADEVCTIFSWNNLYVENEEIIFRSGLNWVNYDPSNRAIDLPSILKNVRMALFTPQFLVDHVATEGLIHSSHSCRDLLDEAKDFHLLPERHKLTKNSVSPRQRSTFGSIYLLGSKIYKSNILSTLEVYHPELSDWKTVAADGIAGKQMGVAVLHNQLYAMGGFNGQTRMSSVCLFDPLSTKWKTLKSLNSGRSAVGASSLNGKLYICGGYDGILSLSSVECYEFETDSWHFIHSLKQCRSSPCVTTLLNLIWVLGGQNALSMECYDPLSGQWMYSVSMNVKRCRAGVAALDGKLYVCGGYNGTTFLNSVEIFDPKMNRWKFLAPMNLPRSRLSLLANNGKLWAIGGYDGFSNLISMETYDSLTNSWTMMPSLCTHSGGVGAGVIHVPPEYIKNKYT